MDNKKSFNLSPVHIAVIKNDEESLKRLIQKKADINVVCGNDGNTPLIEACQRGHIGIISDLLRANAIVSESNSIGKTADQYLEEIKELNKSKLIKDNMLDVFEFYIKKLKKRKAKEIKLNEKRLKQDLIDQKRRIKKKEIESKENKNKKSIGFKKIL